MAGGWRGRPGVAGTRPGVLWVTHRSPPRSVGACALAPGVCTVWIPAGVVQGCGWSLTEQSWLSCLPSRGLGGPRAAVHLDSFPPFILQTLLCHLPGLGSGPGGSRWRNLEPGEEAPGEEGVSGGICEVSGDDILGESESPQEEFAGRPDARHKWVAPAGGMCFCMCGQRTPALLTAPAKGSWPALPQGLCLSPQPCPGPPTSLQGWRYLISQAPLPLNSSEGPLRVPPPPSPEKLVLPLLSGPTSPLHHLFVEALISISLGDISPGGPRGGPALSLTQHLWLGAPAGPLRDEVAPGPEGGLAWPRQGSCLASGR